jgi:tetratricopeptide (TPR) repeat protein
MFDVLPLAFLLLTLLLFGCAATPKHQVALTGNIMVDGPNAIANGPPRDKVLWQYRTAAADMRQGKFDEAKQLLDDALLTLQGIYGKDPDARKARGYFHPEAKKNFIGEPYERAMAYFYRGVLYWRDGQPDNARACFRSAEFEDSDAEKKEYAGDWVLMDYLDGFVTARLGGDGTDALKRAQASAKMTKPSEYNLKANVLVFLEYGGAPVKYATGEHAEQLRFRLGHSPVRGAALKTTGKNVQFGTYDDLYYQATTRGGRVMDHILANKAVFKTTTDTAGDVALLGGLTTAAASNNRTTQNVGLGIALAGLVSKIVSASTTPQADVRTWDNLPQFLGFAALELPPGQQTLTVEFLDSANHPLPNLTKTITVNVPNTGDAVVFASDRNS